VGFCLPGKESRYNIAVIEENENIIGLGAGACSKIMSNDFLTHQNIYHPNDIMTYIQGFKKAHAKMSKLFYSSVTKQNMV
jgi:oxygen-independent coproporphyrinogen-3 oxidase